MNLPLEERRASRREPFTTSHSPLVPPPPILQLRPHRSSFAVEGGVCFASRVDKSVCVKEVAPPHTHTHTRLMIVSTGPIRGGCLLLKDTDGRFERIFSFFLTPSFVVVVKSASDAVRPLRSSPPSAGLPGNFGQTAFKQRVLTFDSRSAPSLPLQILISSFA